MFQISVRLAVGNLNRSLPESLSPCENSLKFYYWDRGTSTHCPWCRLGPIEHVMHIAIFVKFDLLVNISSSWIWKSCDPSTWLPRTLSLRLEICCFGCQVKNTDSQCYLKFGKLIGAQNLTNWFALVFSVASYILYFLIW